MTQIMITHFPILQILFPFFGALIGAFSFNKQAAYIISFACVLASLILSILSYGQIETNPIFYAIGEWPAFVGIEYRIDNFNQPIIIFFNCVLLNFLIFGRTITNNSMLKNIDPKYQHLFFTLLLFAHAGYLGVISTNDLFNIYVFIEISSLSTYVLMSISANRNSLIGAFDYLVMGTIGATLILIGIGFILAETGGLNIDQVAGILQKTEYNQLIHCAISFIIIGCTLKMAFLPMHFWMRRAYNNTSPILLTYLAAIGSIFSIYIFLRFLYFVVDIEHLQSVLIGFLQPLALITILLGSLLALRSNNIKEIIIYSTTAQIGYILLIATILEAQNILFFFLFIDSLNKIALFTITAHIQEKTDNLSIETFVGITNSPLFKTLIAITLLSSSGLPFTSMFFVKIHIFDLLLTDKNMVAFTVTIIGAVLSILYNFRIVRVIFSPVKNENNITVNSNLLGLALIVFGQIYSLSFISNLSTSFEFMY